MTVFVGNICFRMALELEEKTIKEGGSLYKSHKENNTTAVPFRTLCGECLKHKRRGHFHTSVFLFWLPVTPNPVLHPGLLSQRFKLFFFCNVSTKASRDLRSGVLEQAVVRIKHLLR